MTELVLICGSVAMVAGGFALAALLLIASAWAFGTLLWKLQKVLMSITRVTSAIYWVHRMESEGLTICMKDYRVMVSEKKPKTVEDFRDVERAWDRERK